jgi:hypothetical protein
MARKIPAIDRVLQLAVTGRYRKVPELQKALRREGYSTSEITQIDGAALVKHLLGLMRYGNQEPLTSDRTPEAEVAERTDLYFGRTTLPGRPLK